MPRLGWNMEKGTLVKWSREDGEHVQAGEILFVVEADKATQEIEALESGILRIPANSPPPGSEVPVGTLLAYLLKPGEELPDEPSSSRSAAAARRPAPRPAAGGPLPAQGTGRPAARAPKISPRARRVADELGVDWTSLTGSGRSGRIVERDVRQAAGRAPVPATVQVSHVTGSAAAPTTRIPLTPTRRLIAERMTAGAHAAAAVTLTTEADATELVRLRKQLTADPSHPPPSYNDLLAKLLAQTLVQHPAMNARLDDDAIVQYATVNVGLAVDTDRGLLVPVLRDVQAKRLPQIISESAALIEAARAGRIDPDDLQYGTFTITNLGMYGIDTFTPIINLPECAILGVGRIAARQVVVDAEAERVAIRHMMSLSLTFDHRLVDGAPAARFLQRLRQYVEQPYLLLVSQMPERIGAPGPEQGGD